MTKEELEKEAEEYISDNCKRWESDGLTVDDIANEIYLASAEPREKQIAELEEEKCELLGIIQGKDKAIKDLEKENKVLAQNLEDTEIINNTLEKENTELKKQQFSLRNERNTFLAQNEQYEKDLIDFNENLTKAKEILEKLLVHSKRYIWIADDNNKPIMQKEIAEAEQFLKDQEEEA